MLEGQKAKLSRRDFIKVASFVGGTAVLTACAPNLVSRATETPTETKVPASPTPEAKVLIPKPYTVENATPDWAIRFSDNALFTLASEYGIPPEVLNYEFRFTFLGSPYIESPENDVQAYIDAKGAAICKIAVGFYEQEFKEKTLSIPSNWQENDWISVRASEAMLFCYARIAALGALTKEDNSIGIARHYLDSFIKGSPTPLIAIFQRVDKIQSTPTPLGQQA